MKGKRSRRRRAPVDAPSHVTDTAPDDQFAVAPKRASSWEELRSWIALILAVGGLAVALWDHISSRDERRVASRLANQEDLAAAIDLLGGQKGSIAIPVTGTPPSRAILTRAEQQVERALTRNANDAMALWLRGICKQFRGKHDEAEADYKLSATFSPDDAWRAHNSLGGLYFSQGRWLESAAAYKDAIQLRPRSEVLHYNVALVHLRLGNLDAAEKALKTATAIDKTFGEAFIALAEVCRRRGDSEQAIAALANVNAIPEPLRSRTAEPSSTTSSITQADITASSNEGLETSSGTGSLITTPSTTSAESFQPLTTVASLQGIKLSTVHTYCVSRVPPSPTIRWPSVDALDAPQFSPMALSASGQRLTISLPREPSMRAATPDTATTVSTSSSQ